MRIRLRELELALLFLVVLLCSSCGSDSAPTAGEHSVSYELFPSTHELGPADIAALDQISDDGTLRFQSTPDSLTELEPGDVLLSGISKKTPYGLLRVVLRIDQEDGQLVLRTAAAPLQLAFRRLHANIVDETTPFSTDERFTGTDFSPLSLRPRFSIAGDLGDHQNYEVVVFDGDGNTDTKNDQVVIDATLGGGFRYALRIDMDWDAVDRIPQTVKECLLTAASIVIGQKPKCDPTSLLPELTLAFEVAPHLEAALDVRGSASIGFEQSFDVGTIVLAPFTVGPLVIVPNADIIATVSGKASASFSARTHANIEVSTSAVLSSKSENSRFVPFELKKIDAGGETPEVDLYAEASAKAGVRLVLALYGVLGPYAQVDAGATLLANPLQDPCWDLHVGLDTQFGVLVKTPSLPLIGAYTFLDWNTGSISLYDQSVVTGRCDLTEEGARPPPGGGPSAELLQKPTFTPWAKLLGLAAEGADLESVLALPTGFPSLTPSVDGRYVATGAGALGLVKLDEDGDTTWQGSALDTRDEALVSVGSVPSIDAGILTLYRITGFGGFVIGKRSQSGAALSAVSVGFPDDCGASTAAIAQDPSGGALIVGECPSTQSAWLVRLDRNLTLIDSQRIVDSDPSTIRVTPTVLFRQGDEWIIAGQLARTGEAAGNLGFFVRVNDQLAPVVNSAFACPDRLSFYPTAGIASQAGAVTLVGDAAGLGFVARVKPDGSLGFVRFPNLGGGVQTGFSPNAVVELPTTGLVLASTVSGEGDNPTDVILLGLDGNGRTMWGREYFLRGARGLRAFGWPSALLTDDGGVLLTATAGPDGAKPGELLAMKVFARDGSLPDDSLISNSPVTPEESDLLVEARPFMPTLEPLSVTVEPFTGSTPPPQ